MPDLLSVVIPTYNRASLLPRALGSLLAHTRATLEVIVVDDGSEDDTEAVVARISDSRVRYLSIPHGGVSAARNAGASAAKGRWLAFLDSDDEVLPGWADAMVRVAEQSGSMAVCGGEAVDMAGNSLWTWTPPPDGEPRQQRLSEMFLPGMFVVDRKTFLDAGGYVEDLAFGENTELALRLLFVRRSPLASEPRVLVKRHVSTSRDVYSASRIASARFVLQEHPWLRHELPALWASYHALVGVDEARRREWRSATGHFLSAVAARPSLEHLGRAAAAGLPVVRTRVWATRPAASGSALRVLLLVPEYPPEETGGIASYTRDLAHGLAALGQRVDVLVVRRDQTPADLDEGSVRLHRRAQSRLIPGSRRWRALGRLENASFVQRLAHAASCRRHIRDLGSTFDVIEGCDWMAGTLLLRRRRHVPVVLHVHGAAAQVERRGRPSLAAQISEMMEVRALRRSNLVTVPTPAMAERVKAQVGRRHPVRLVPCPTEVRSDVPPNAPTPSVLYVGRLDWLKAPEVLVQAGALVREHVPEVEIKFVGRPHGRRDGIPYGEWLADLAEREKSPCRFLGPMSHSDVVREIASSRVVAVTSRFEAFGLSAAEALGQGRPVVCTEDCGISFLLTRPAGIVVRFGDPLTLADALRQYLPGGALAAAAPEAALAVARESLSPAVVAREKLACYREALS